MWSITTPPHTHQRRVPGSQTEPHPDEDYYTLACYEPTALVNEWRALQEELAIVSAHGATVRAADIWGRPYEEADTDSRPRRLSPCPRPLPTREVHASTGRHPTTSTAGRKPRNSLALELHYATRKQRGPEDRSSDGGAPSSSSSITDSGQAQGPTSPPRVPYAFASDPYDRSREIARQEQFLSENKRLGRPFVPSSVSEGAPTRLLLGDCVRDLYRSVLRDWPTAEPMVVSTAEDLIVVYFALHSIKKGQTSAVLAYMNAFAQRNEAVRQFRLTKVREGWDILTEDAHLMYTFRPPWVPKSKRFLPDTVKPTTAHVL